MGRGGDPPAAPLSSFSATCSSEYATGYSRPAASHLTAFPSPVMKVMSDRLLAQRSTIPSGEGSARKRGAEFLRDPRRGTYLKCPPFGAGSPFKPDGLNNPFSPYGSQFNNQSATNPFASDVPRRYDQQGNYRGKLSTNPYDPDSTSNPYGPLRLSVLARLDQQSLRRRESLQPQQSHEPLRPRSAN
jgi:hypothetical protein